MHRNSDMKREVKKNLSGFWLTCDYIIPVMLHTGFRDHTKGTVVKRFRQQWRVFNSAYTFVFNSAYTFRAKPQQGITAQCTHFWEVSGGMILPMWGLEFTIPMTSLGSSITNWWLLNRRYTQIYLNPPFPERMGFLYPLWCRQSMLSSESRNQAVRILFS